MAAGALFGAPALPVCNVRDYGAAADGTARSTAAFRKAVEACAAVGGGTVYVPPGTYITGAIELKSNITLHVEAGATLKFHNDRAEYPIVTGRLEGIECLTPSPLIGGRNLENVTITGRGTLTADNAAWRKEQGLHEDGHDMWTSIVQRIERKEKISEADFRKAATWLRPSFIRPMDSKNILIEGIHIAGSPMWTLHLLYCDNVVIRNVTVETYPGANTDGVDIDSSRNVRIFDSYFDTGDDDICIKSGRDVDGRRVNRRTEDIAISNCITHHGHGAVVVGSETAGGVRNVSASNIVVRGTDHGVRVKSGRGRGGTVENLRFQGWTMEDVRYGILITNYYTKIPQEPVTERTPVFRDIAVSNMTILRAATAVSLEGLPEMPVNNVRISDIIANGDTGLSAHDFAGLQLNNVEVNAGGGPAFLIKDVTGLELNGVAERKPNAAPVIRLDNCPDAIVRAGRALAGTVVFLSLAPGQQGHTILEGNQVAAAKTSLEESDKDWWSNQKKPSKKPK
jgi:polygalacturonase